MQGGRALDAAAALGLDVGLPVVLVVVVVQFLAGLYIALGHHVHAVLVDVDFAVGAARVVDVARGVPAGRAVYGDAALRVEEVEAVAFLFLLFGKDVPAVLDDARALGDVRKGEEPEARERALDLQIKIAGLVLAPLLRLRLFLHHFLIFLS